MPKREDFLMIVQTDMLMHFQNSLAQLEQGFNVYGLGQYSGSMGDAIRASYRIPNNMNCVEAAGEFMQFFFWQEMQGEENMECPSWFDNLDNQHL